ncbi:MAG: twin-arginine translocase subunit TatB [Methylophaga sp.]|nr:twin-arginine translocase subunit TatB [Rhizobiaceae bacterium]PHS30710.1 MAG: twin-arginine translocase subunit TatB [Methylophaga sp.]
MFDIGFWEIFLITVVALVVVGPERLPKLVRVTGLWIGRANSSIQSIRNEISQELRAEELKQALDKTVNLDEITSMEPKSITPKEAAETKALEKDTNDNG